MAGKRDPVWDQTLAEFRAALAGSQPVPAGVAAAVVSSSLALALLEKVLTISAAREPAHRRMARTARHLILELEPMPQRDLDAFERYRQKRIPARALKAAQVPLECARLVISGFQLAARSRTKGLIDADRRVAATMLAAAAEALLECAGANAQTLPLSASASARLAGEVNQVLRKLATCRAQFPRLTPDG